MNLKLKIERIKKDMTQEQLASRANICRLTISNIETGKQNIDSLKLGTLKKLAKALNTTVEELFFNQEEI